MNLNLNKKFLEIMKLINRLKNLIRIEFIILTKTFGMWSYNIFDLCYFQHVP